MNWGKGLRRLWMVGTALWIVAVMVFGYWHYGERVYPPATAAQGVWAAELYAEYWYYRIIRPDVAAEARRVHSVFDDPTSPSHCVSYWDRKQLEDKLAKDKAEEAKRPPRAPGQMSTADLDRLWMPAECSAEVEKAKDKLGEIWALRDAVEKGGWVPDALLSFALWLFSPPIATLLVGASMIGAFRWAFRGFRVADGARGPASAKCRRGGGASNPLAKPELQ
jgi:hypothetical protein